MTDGKLVSPDFRRLEAVIEKGMRTFVDVGRALMDIRDKRMYRELDFSSFDDYTRERWGWSRVRAHQLIDAAKVSDAVLTMVNTAPASERQARELARADDPITVWAEVVENHEPAEITAAVIREHVQARSENHTPPVVEIVVEPLVMVDPRIEPWRHEFRGAIHRALALGATTDNLRDLIDEEA